MIRSAKAWASILFGVGPDAPESGPAWVDEIQREAMAHALRKAAAFIEDAERGQRRPYALGTFPKVLRRHAEAVQAGPSEGPAS